MAKRKIGEPITLHPDEVTLIPYGRGEFRLELWKKPKVGPYRMSNITVIAPYRESHQRYGNIVTYKHAQVSKDIVRLSRIRRRR